MSKIRRNAVVPNTFQLATGTGSFVTPFLNQLQKRESSPTRILPASKLYLVCHGRFWRHPRLGTTVVVRRTDDRKQKKSSEM